MGLYLYRKSRTARYLVFEVDSKEDWTGQGSLQQYMSPGYAQG